MRVAAPALTMLALVVGAQAAACAVCEDNGDCDVGDLCVEGLCAPPPPPRVSILSPRRPVGDTFEMAVEVGFRGDEATITLERVAGDAGEPCLPFPPVIRRVGGTPDTYATRVVVFSALPALGESFSILARLEVNGIEITAQQAIVGPPPPPEVGGVRILEPVRVDVDALRTPLLALRVDSPTPPVAFAEAAAPHADDGARAPPTPRVALSPSDREWSGAVPTLRGPWTLWVEADVDGVTRRCGHGLTGGPDEIGDDELEILLVSRSVDGDPHLVELSTRVGDAFCGGQAPTPLPCASHVAASEGESGRDGLVLGMVDGLIEIAAVPRIVSGPVEVQIRVSRGDRHVALFGPVTLQPALGETWIGGSLSVTGGEIVAVIEAVAPPVVGLPW